MGTSRLRPPRPPAPETRFESHASAGAPGAAGSRVEFMRAVGKGPGGVWLKARAPGPQARGLQAECRQGSRARAPAHPTLCSHLLKDPAHSLFLQALEEEETSLLRRVHDLCGFS